MQSSVTPSRARSGRNAFKVSSSAEAAPASSRRSGFELIYPPEIQVPRDEHLDAIPLRLADGGRNIDGVLQDFRHDILRGGRVDDHRAVRARGDLALDRPVDHGDQDRGAKALEEMPID